MTIHNNQWNRYHRCFLSTHIDIHQHITEFLGPSEGRALFMAKPIGQEMYGIPLKDLLLLTTDARNRFRSDKKS